jgi:hypothetical protein
MAGFAGRSDGHIRPPSAYFPVYEDDRSSQLSAGRKEFGRQRQYTAE